MILKRSANIKYKRFVFTEQGVAMLSSAPNSPHAARANIQIMRTFARSRKGKVAPVIEATIEAD